MIMTICFVMKYILNKPISLFLFLDDQWMDCHAKFRYRQQDIPVKIKKMGNETIIVQSDVPLKAITPGQIAVFYDKNTEQVIASGIIDTCYKNKKKLDLI